MEVACAVADCVTVSEGTLQIRIHQEIGGSRMSKSMVLDVMVVSMGDENRFERNWTLLRQQTFSEIAARNLTD